MCSIWSLDLDWFWNGSCVSKETLYCTQRFSHAPYMQQGQNEEYPAEKATYYLHNSRCFITTWILPEDTNSDVRGLPIFSLFMVLLCGVQLMRHKSSIKLGLFQYNFHLYALRKYFFANIHLISLVKVVSRYCM